MTITLLAVSLNENPLSQPITASFDSRGGTIGRADHNTMALPDPERHISRLQAEVLVSGSSYHIKNVGAANPITVAGRQLLAGDSAPLTHHDEVRIGGYLLRVIDDAGADVSGAQITRGRAMVHDTLHGQDSASGARPPLTPPRPVPVPAQVAPSGPVVSPPLSGGAFGDLVGGSLSSSNPFADLLGTPARPPQPGPASRPPPGRGTDPFGDLLPPPTGVPAASAALPQAPPSSGPHLPDDFDPFKQPTAASGPQAASPPRDPFADLMPAGNGASIDTFFGLGHPSAGSSALDGFAAGAGHAAPAPLGRGGSTDPLAMFGNAPAPAPTPPLSGRPDHTPNLNAAFAAPKWTAPAAPAPAPASSAPAPEAMIPPDATWLRPRPTLSGPLRSPAGVAPPADPFAGLHSPAVAPAPAFVPVPAPVAGSAGSTDGSPSGFGAVASPAPAPAPARADAGTDREQPGSSPMIDLPLDPFDPAPPVAGETARPALVSAPPIQAEAGVIAPARPAGSAAAASVAALPPIPPAIGVAAPAPVVPAPAARPAAPHTAASAPAADAAVASAESLWRAFCEGLGARIDLPQGLDEATMRALGEMLHAATAGALQLIAVRASTKQELRADVTIIRPQENNPLKFTPDAVTAIDQMLRPPMRGFMAGPQAMTDAMNDLVGHSIGTMAGMRAALEGVLDRFSPDQLEAKLSGSSLLDSLLPMNRKARLWDLYLQHFGSIRDEAQDDFHTLFGKAFLAAYEQQQERLRQTRP